MENIQKNRDELLGTTRDTIRGLSEYVDAFMSDNCICVIGSAEKIDESKEMFDKVEQLVNR
jgi:Zn-dependent M16 (insulinase) family peptidase